MVAAAAASSFSLVLELVGLEIACSKQPASVTIEGVAFVEFEEDCMRIV